MVTNAELPHYVLPVHGEENLSSITVIREAMRRCISKHGNQAGQTFGSTREAWSLPRQKEGDNSVTNLKYVDLAEAQALLLEFIDGEAAPAPGGHVNARGEGTEERPLDLDFEA